MQKISKEAIWISGGSQRQNVFKNLPVEPFMPNKFRKKFEGKISLRELSRHLGNFKEQKLIICLNKNAPFNKLYQLTNKGKSLQREINKIIS
jgi:hypothetical protein